MMYPLKFWVFLSALALCLFSCSSGNNSGSDSGSQADNAQVILDCSLAVSGESCEPIGASCSSTVEWCGHEVETSGCNCNNGKWECWATGALAPCCSGCEQGTDGDACCQEHFGANASCGSDGSCVEQELCEAPHCCLDGAEGDAYCAESYGSCSSCVQGTCSSLDCCAGASAGESCDFGGQMCELKGDHCGEELVLSDCVCKDDAWLCTEKDLSACCSDCTQDNEGHACCAEFNTEMFFCDFEGGCIEAPVCDSADCCVPGEPGDAYCKKQFEECSSCLLQGSLGTCSRTACPDSCTQDLEGHAACKIENDATYFCGSESICIQTSGCKALFCCVPGESGNDFCAGNFGECSQCAVIDDDGRCDPMMCD
jgi:hypothetical protein